MLKLYLKKLVFLVQTAFSFVFDNLGLQIFVDTKQKHDWGWIIVMKRNLAS